MPVFKREFMKNLKGLIIWALSIAGLLALMLGQFKAMDSSLDVSGYTQQFKEAMGMDKIDMNTFLGYYAIKASVVVTLFGGIYAAMLGSMLVVKDESLLARPVSRGKIAIGRLLAAVVNILVFNLVILAVILSVEYDQKVFWIVLGQFLLHMIFVSVGFLSAFVRIRSKAAMIMPVGLVLATYVLTLIYGMSDKLEFVKYLSPFYYTDIKEIIANSGMNAVNTLVACALVCICAALGYLVYTKRDLPS